MPNRPVPPFADRLVIQHQHRANWHLTFILSTLSQRQCMAHPVFIITRATHVSSLRTYLIKAILLAILAAHYTYMDGVLKALLQLLQAAFGRHAPAMFTEIEQRIVLLTVAIAAVEFERRA